MVDAVGQCPRDDPLQLSRRVWGQDQSGGSGPVRAIVKRLRRELDSDADNPTFIFTEPRVGYRMANGERLVSEPTWAFA